MGTGYVRNDTTNNIADGGVIDAADLDGEFNAVVAAFNESTGHTHDGTGAEGAPIEVLGPAQDFIGDASALAPKTTATYTLGKPASTYSNIYVDNLTVAGTAIVATPAEINNLSGVTASTAEINHLVGQDQGVATTDSPTFVDGTFTGDVNIGDDLNLTGPNPVITLTDNDVADEYTKLTCSGGNTFLDGRAGASNGPIIFRGAGGGVNTQYGRFSAAGNFGIDDTSPAEKLSVTGNIAATGTVTATGGTFTNTTAAEAGLTVSGATSTGWGLEIATHNGGAASDLVLNGNAVVGHEVSVSYTIPTSGYYRWMAGATSNTGGIAGSSEIMRLTDTGGITAKDDATINDITFGRGAGGVLSNTVSGYQALRNNTTGSSNTASGYQALFNNTAGDNNTASGRDALRSNTTGSSNVASGREALYSNTTGFGNVASGFQVLYNNTTGSYNVASGHQALYVNTTGGSNAASGYQALRNNTTGSFNAASGYQALYINTTGSANTASGYQALRSNTTGFHNTASGYQALESNTAGTYNTASGYQALESNTTGASNVASGHQALQSNTTGFGNTASGRESLHSNTTGNSNTASGREALYSNTTGFGNAASGHQALYSNTTGGSNAAIGLQALYGNTTGSANTASGYQALYSNTTGSFNAAIGREALRNNTTGSNNTASGYQALRSNTTGSGNTASGRYALESNTAGGGNAAIGHEALLNNTTGNYNTASGYQALHANTTGGSNTASGYLALQNNTTGSGNTAINPRTSGGSYAPVFDPTTENNRFCMGSTSVTNAYIQVAWTVVSDERDKTEMKPVPHGLDFVKELKPTSFRYKADRADTEGHGPTRYGFLAQDILALEGDNPVIIDSEDPEKLRMTDQALIAVLVNAVQDQQKIIETLEGRITALENT